MISIVCPQCQLTLVQQQHELICSSCGRTGWNDGNLIDFLKDVDFYWGEISREEMRWTNSIAKEKGYLAAMRSITAKYPDLEEYLFSGARIDWLFHCYSSQRNGACLDIGSGWGSLTFTLAKFYKEVWSLEAVRERIEFQKIRREQERLDNIFLVRGNMLWLPFPDKSFDLVVANGVLEWAGVVNQKENVPKVQLDFLKELRRVLKPGGCLYIGIENRFGGNMILGGCDHSGLRFTSLVPRKIASMIVKIFRKTGGLYHRRNRIADEWDDYRTYTYSHLGYQKLLKRAGFETIEIYWAMPSYNKPKYSGRLQNSAGFLSFLQHFCKTYSESSRKAQFLRILCSSVFQFIPKYFLKYFSYGFLIFAYKGEKPFTLQQQILEDSSNFSFRLSGFKKNLYFLDSTVGQAQVLKFPRFKDEASSLEREMKQFSSFQNLHKKVHSGFTILKEPVFKGKGIETYNLRHNLKAMNWLLDFHRESQSGYWTRKDFEAEVQQYFEKLRISGLNADFLKSAEQFCSEAMNLVVEAPIEKVSEHGDFWSGNILRSTTGELYVIDWDFYRPIGDSLYDFCFFIVINSKKGKNEEEAFYQTFTGNSRYTPILRTLLHRYAEKKGIAIGSILKYIPYMFVRTVSAYIPTPGKYLPNFHVFQKLVFVWNQINRETIYRTLGEND